MKHLVQLTKFAEKQIRKLPKYIQISVRVWSEVIENEGVERMRSIPGYHDEPLKGSRRGQRSSRLNKAYRVIYEELPENEFIVISIMEVNKHDY